MNQQLKALDTKDKLGPIGPSEEADNGLEFRIGKHSNDHPHLHNPTHESAVKGVGHEG
jgi:hypothetical protein